jgi:hypothetical protein
MSITERPVSPALKTMLVNNEPFQYAHLIKFERPSRPDSLSGLVSTAKERYTYLTDASINVSFDDGSKDLNGTANGAQVYLANKVLSVGAIQEQTKATTSNTSLVLDGNGLGADITANASIAVATIDPLTTAPIEWDITFSAPISLDDLLAEGFREGDKITVLNGVNPGTDGNGVPVNIVSFRANNVLRVKRIDSGLVISSAISTRFKLASEEIISILLNKNSSEYASFINREVFIYKAYFQNGVVVGTPICIFKGIINGVSFEDSDTSIRVTWGLSSHWADFSQVKGRVTSDSAHRALDANGIPQVASALKPIYAYDKGFIHGETSINILAKYSVQVEKQEIKVKKGFLGLFPKVKIKKSLVNEDRFTDLDLQIQAKSIPVIYGVRKAEPIPIFADTRKNNSAEVYVAFVLCEGEIGGIYDVYIDGNSLICNDAADFDARATQTSDKTVEVVCRGRSDRGDVLGGVTSVAPTSYDYFTPTGERVSISSPEIGNYPAAWRANNYIPPTENQSFNNYGIIDGQSISLTSPSNMTLDVFTGKSGQKASALLSKIAFDKDFKIQESYWTGADTYEYWGPNHRLIDTAYLVGKFIISEGDTTIPELGFIVRGKVIDCYNYDYSYLHDQKATLESHTNFSLGDTVTLWRSDNNTQINLADSIQIIDKWTFINPDGTANVRFRLSITPALGYDADGKPSIKRFYMKSASNATWTMTTYNYNIYGSEYSDTANREFVEEPVAAQISSTTNSSGALAITYASNVNMTINGDTTNSSPLFSVTKLSNGRYERLSDVQTFESAIISGPVTSTNIVSDYPFATYAPEVNTVVGTGPTFLASENTVKIKNTLINPASIVNDYYKGYLIEITRYNSITGKSLIQVAEIVGYNGTTRIVTIDGIWDFIPSNSDTVRIYPKYADSRVSTNPAIQTLDYITSPSYGKGLDIYKDLDLPSWLDAARKCDTRSDVTVLISSGAPVIGSVYRYTNSAGKIIWQGKVASILGNYVTFTDVLGKLTNKWNSWKTFNKDEILYNVAGSLYKVTSDPGAVISTEPTSTTTPSGLVTLSSLTLSLASGSGSFTLGVNTSSGNPVQGIKNGQKISGYSIYDCDDINYWKVSGWDEHAQRYATKNQCNITLDTSAPLFDNVNGMLEHFNGILRYTAGKYYLDIEESEPFILISDIRTITVDDIIGKIQLSDEGTRSAFNSLTASFADPANKFEPRNVSFFNSDYLKADRNVSKKGNLSVPGITNYYNTRTLADSFLNKSRFGLTINMTVRPSGFLLLAGTVIQVVYPKYDWVSPGKKFRIESINYQPDGLVDVVAKEYDDSFYIGTNIRRVAGTGATTVPTTTTPGNPTGLIVTSADTQDELKNGVELFWDNNPVVNQSANASTEIYGSLSPNLFVTVTSITSNTLTTSTVHGLIPGMPVYLVDNYIVSGTTQLDSNDVYYVLTVPTTTSFTLTSNKTGANPTAVPLTNGTALNLRIRTATLLGAVPTPVRSFIDSMPNAGTGRVEKYYWVRHRINRA